jgi:shikimate kinase
VVIEPNLVLVGFMGTGKTEVGRIVSERIGRDFVDIDDRIVQAAGMSINEVFRIYGEDYFRDIETTIIEEFSALGGLVISTGGGSLLRIENVRNLKRSGVLICLTASPEEIVRRVADDRHRPLLNVTDRIGVVREMLARRSPSYRVSDFMISTDGKSPDAAAIEVLDSYRRFMNEWKGWR